MLLNPENPTVARLRAADLLLKDIDGGTFGDPSEIASDALKNLLTIKPTSVERKENYEHVKQVVELWNNSLSKEKKTSGLTIREINSELEENHELPKSGNLTHTKRALEELGWISNYVHGTKRWTNGG